jgi:hypothetical protein
MSSKNIKKYFFVGTLVGKGSTRESSHSPAFQWTTPDFTLKILLLLNRTHSVGDIERGWEWTMGSILRLFTSLAE